MGKEAYADVSLYSSSASGPGKPQWTRPEKTRVLEVKGRQLLLTPKREINANARYRRIVIVHGIVKNTKQMGRGGTLSTKPVPGNLQADVVKALRDLGMGKAQKVRFIRSELEERWDLSRTASRKEVLRRTFLRWKKRQ